MYSNPGYVSMIAERVRMRAYTAALRNAVKPGSVVLDLGAGKGIFAVLACRFGARRVYAIEPSDAIEVASQTAVDSFILSQMNGGNSLDEIARNTIKLFLKDLTPGKAH
jgi:predicted RNA methylase